MRAIVSFWLSVFVCVQMHAMEQQLPSKNQLVTILAGGQQFEVGPEVLGMLGTLHNVCANCDKDPAPTSLAQRIDAATFGTMLDCCRTSLQEQVGYEQRVTSIFDTLQKHCPGPERTSLLLGALDFLQALVSNPFGDALALHCARVLSTIAGSLGKPHHELSQDSRDKMMLLDNVLRYALAEPNFTINDPPLSLPPFAREILKNKESRTWGEVELLLREHTDLQYFEDLPGIATVESLSLDNNAIAALSAKVSCLPNLKKLWLKEWPQVASLSGEIGKFSTLTYLCCIRNDLRSLPETIGDLYNLVELPLYQNKLTSVPRSIGKLSSLWRLALRENQIASLPNEIGRLCSLVSLSLDDNQLTSVPSSIGQLTLLTFLGLHNNRLTSLPDEICGLKELRALSLFGNDISRLPQSVGKLCRLQNLSLDKDRLVLGEATRIGTVLSRCRICERV